MWVEEPGIYEAVVLSTKKVRRFGLWTIEFRFRLVTPGPTFDLQVSGYCSVGPNEKPPIRPHSKLASWARLLATFSGISPSRITLRSFRQYWLRVRVETVKRNARQQPLALMINIPPSLTFGGGGSAREGDGHGPREPDP